MTSSHPSRASRAKHRLLISKEYSVKLNGVLPPATDTTKAEYERRLQAYEDTPIIADIAYRVFVQEFIPATSTYEAPYELDEADIGLYLTESQARDAQESNLSAPDYDEIDDAPGSIPSESSSSTSYLFRLNTVGSKYYGESCPQLTEGWYISEMDRDGEYYYRMESEGELLEKLMARYECILEGYYYNGDEE